MFYHYTEETGLTYGPHVQFPDGNFLHLDLLETYQFPVQDWYYFETEQEAKDFFGIKDSE